MNERDRLFIEAQCARLSHDFAFSIDQRDYARLVEQFAEDGVWVRHGEDLKGRAAILAAMQERPADRFARHLTTNIHFAKVSEIEATAVVSCIAFFASHLGDPPAILANGQCMVIEFWDEYIFVDSHWVIKRRDTRPIMLPANMFDAMLGKH